MALPDPHRSRAVLVGIADYTHADLVAMPAAARGADHLARLLREPSIWGLPHEYVTVLGTDTTQERILTAVRDAALATEDTLVVYFAGHGLRDPGERLHLALVDADPDYPQIGTLPYRQLRDLIRQAGHRAKHRVTVLDCCYSGIAGGMSHPTAPTRDELATALDERAHANATDGVDEGRHGSDEDDHGDCVLTSAPPQSRSFVRAGAPFPEFTGELIATLEAGIIGVGPMISLEGAWLRVRDRMRGRDSPEPQLFAQNNATRHIHFLNRAPRERREQSAAASDPAPGASAAHLEARAAAERAARALPDVYYSMSVLADIAAATVTVDPDKTRQLTDEVLRASHGVTNPDQRARLLAQVATSLVGLDSPRGRDLVDEAQAAVLAIGEPDARFEGLYNLAHTVAAADRDRATWLLEKVEECAHSVPDARDKVMRLRVLSNSSLLDDSPAWRQRLRDEADHVESAAEQSKLFDEYSRESPEGSRRASEARANPDSRWTVVELVKIARDLDQSHPHQAVELLEDAERTVRKIGVREREEREEALSELTGALPFCVSWAARTIPDRVVDLVTKVRHTVNDHASHAQRDQLTDLAWTLAITANELAKTNPRRAVELIREAQAITPQPPGKTRQLLHKKVAEALTKIGAELTPIDAEQAVALAHEARKIAAAQDDTLHRVHTDSAAMRVLALAGQHLARADTNRSAELFREAESLARRLPKQELWPVPQALAMAGKSIAGTNPDQMDTFVQQSERLARDLPEKDRQRCLQSIADALIKTGNALVDRDPDHAALYAREAERIVRQISNDRDRDFLLYEIMGLQAEVVTRRPAYADRAKQVAERMPDDGFKAFTLQNLAIALAPADSGHAERIAQDITDDRCRARALASIAKARL
ncbi:hypothetical protein GCM10009577_87000 [Streptomyces javensis]